LTEKTVAWEKIYYCISKLLSYPEYIDSDVIEECRKNLFQLQNENSRTMLKEFIEKDFPTITPERYVEFFDMGGHCSLYLSSYTGFPEEKKRFYYVQMKQYYRLFGLKLRVRELPDYLPIVAEFLYHSKRKEKLKRERTSFIERYVMPYLDKLFFCLKNNNNPYYKLVFVLKEQLTKEVFMG